jgi:putative DNA primase/helicase
VGENFLGAGAKPAGYFEDFKTGIKANWKADGPVKPLTNAERVQFAEAKKQRDQQQAQRYEQTAQIAQRLINQSLTATNDHSYLARKRVDAHDLRLLRFWKKRHRMDGEHLENIVVENVLIVPLTDITGKLWNLQAIFPATHPKLGRDKDFLSGGRLGGLFHVIGKQSDEIIICEGWATGASLYEATGSQVYCALSAGNLLPVAKALRESDKGKKIILAADNDEKTPGNPGLTAAKKAALAIGGLLAVPPIPGDFNDFASANVEGSV